MRRFIRFMTNGQHRAVLFALMVGLAGFGISLHSPVAHASCEPANDIINCGFTSKSNFINTVNGSSELKHIYSAYGLESTAYNNFTTHAVPGLAYKDNTLRLSDGTIVARDTDSIGREWQLQGKNYFTQTIPGAGTYYGNTNDRAFQTGPLSATVLLDDHDKVVFAVLNSCGNPIGAPNYRCNTLHETPVAGTHDEFKFSSDVTANSTAKVKRVVYDFGDGKTDAETDPSLVITHKYAKSGNYTAKVTLYVSIPHATDGQTTPAGDCIKVIKVVIPPPPPPPPAPVYACINLTAAPISGSHFNYKYVVTTSAANGAVVKSVDFDFGDKSPIRNVKEAAGSNMVTTTYAFDKSKAALYHVVATIHVSLPNGKTDAVSSNKCKKTVAVNVPFYSCVGLSWTLVDEATHKYTLAATADFQNVTFTNAQFDFGDHSPIRTVKATAGNLTVSTTYSYAAAGTYHIAATLNFKDNNKVVSARCTNTITPGTTTSTCQPTSPQSGALCNPCASNPNVPANSSECVLPNTGAGDVIGIAGAAAVVGFFLYRQFISRKKVANNVSGAAIDGDVVHPHHDDNEVTAQVIAHHHPEHRNTKGLHHATYHKPHRFRPRSHKDDK